MNTSITADQYNIMNSLLDKELEGLKNSSHYSIAGSEKENRDLNKSRELTTKDFNNSFQSSEKKPSGYRKEPSDITNKITYNSYTTDVTEPTNKSLKMQEDLLELQSKILNLEKRITSMNNTSPIRRSDNAPLQSDLGFQKHQESRMGDSRMGDSKLNDSFDNSPLEKKYAESQKSPFRVSTSQIGKKNPKENSFSKHPVTDKDASSDSERDEEEEEEEEDEGYRKKIKSSISTPQHRGNKFVVDQNLRDAQTKLNQLKGQIKRSSSQHGKSRSVSRGRGLATQSIEGGNYQEIHILNKRLLEYKKRHEEDKEALLKERLRNQELTAQVEKLNKKIKKMQIDLEKYTKFQGDYNKLMESFEKSEYVRNQQKQIIANLNYEIEQLRRENEEISRSTGQSFPVSLGEEKKKKKRGKSKTKKKLLM